MKIRSGFVSNSSSSSFIVRGFKVKKDDMVKINGGKEFDAYVPGLLEGFSVYDTQDFFDGTETDDCIVGVEVGNLEDGVVTQLKEPNEDEDDSIFVAVATAGLKVYRDSIRTYVQMISNDHY